jgi:plasmid maintenance system antidote protein VapI
MGRFWQQAEKRLRILAAATTIHQLISGKRSIIADTAFRLSQYFGMFC